MEIGDVFANRYVVQRELARLASGNVYLAQDQQTKERVAIKWLPVSASNYANYASRMRREAEVTRRMQGQRFVRIIDQGVAEGIGSHLIMEYLRGQPLSEVLRHEAPLTVSRTAALARQTLEALGAAHSQGIVHRDLKPKNIFVCDTTDGGYVKVLDLGAAATAGSAGNAATTDLNKLTARDSGLGTPDYMSPEQCRGGVVNAASDLYSLGVVLFEALTGEPPFKDPNPVQVMLMQMSRPAPAMPDEIGRTPLGRAVMTALQKDPTARFASAQDFLAAIAPQPAGSAPRGSEQSARAPGNQTLMLSGAIELPTKGGAASGPAGGPGPGSSSGAAVASSSSAASGATATKSPAGKPSGGPTGPNMPRVEAPEAAVPDKRGPKPAGRGIGAGWLVAGAIVILLILLVASVFLLD